MNIAISWFKWLILKSSLLNEHSILDTRSIQYFTIHYPTVAIISLIWAHWPINWRVYWQMSESIVHNMPNQMSNCRSVMANCSLEGVHAIAHLGLFSFQRILIHFLRNDFLNKFCALYVLIGGIIHSLLSTCWLIDLSLLHMSVCVIRERFHGGWLGSLEGEVLYN